MSESEFKKSNVKDQNISRIINENTLMELTAGSYKESYEKIIERKRIMVMNSEIIICRFDELIAMDLTFQKLIGNVRFKYMYTVANLPISLQNSELSNMMTMNLKKLVILGINDKSKSETGENLESLESLYKDYEKRVLRLDPEMTEKS